MEPTKDMSSISELPSHDDEPGKNKRRGFVRTVRRGLAAVGLGVALLGGVGGDINTQGNEPMRTPLPPAADVQHPKESPTPTLSVEKIPLNPKGRLFLFNQNEHDNPKIESSFVIYAQDATVIGIEKDTENNLLWIGVSVPGDSVQEKILEADKNDPLSYTENVFTGATLWFNISEKTPIITDTFSPFPVGYGSEVLPYIKVGETIPNIMANTAYNKDYDPSRTPGEIAQNANIVDDLKSSTGKNFLSSDKRFSLFADAVWVSAPGLNLNSRQP